MILYFSDNTKTVIFERSVEALEIIIEESRDFNKYINKKLNTLNHIDFIALDLDYITDDDDSLINAINKFKIHYPKKGIIIVAISRSEGDLLLAKLYENGVYNFITAKDFEGQIMEAKQCFDEDLDGYKKRKLASKYKVEIVQETKKKGFFSRFKKNKKDKKAPLYDYSSNDEEYKDETPDIYDYPEEDAKTSRFNELDNLDKKDSIDEINNKALNESLILEDKKVGLENRFEDKKIKNLETVDDLFGNTNFETKDDKLSEKSRFSKSNRNIYFETVTINDVEIKTLVYFRQKIGAVKGDTNTCYIDPNYLKRDVKEFLDLEGVNFKVREGMCSNIKKLLN